VVVLLGSSLATIMAAPTPASTTYTLIGYVDQPGGASAPPVPNGVTVDLVSAATGTTYTAVTSNGGEFSFTSSSTSGSLGPGYWKLLVPTETNVSVSGCGQCAVLPQNQNPTFAYYNYSQLTSKNYSTILTDVSVFPYNATLNGTVYQGGQPVPGVAVKLLDPDYNALVVSNTTTNVNGTYSMNVPRGHWILQSIHVSGPDTFTNSTPVNVSARYPPLVNPVLSSFTVSGWINSTLGRIPTTGNATLYDPANGYIYSTSTPAGGYYSLSTYLGNFTKGSQSFDVILAANGYGTTWYPLVVHTSGQITHNVVVPKMAPSSMGVYTTGLDLSKINTLTGKGNLTVSTSVVLGNDSVVPNLPNATVGQLWAQLGLDFNHSLTFPESEANSFKAFLNSEGPFFLATQAATTLNATAFVAPNASSTIASFVSGCAAYCGLTSSANLTYGWTQTYALNGTVAKNSSSYTLGFTFAHPASSSLVYNYSVTLPAGYILAAGTAPPSHALLDPTGPDGTWGSFTLVSQAATTASASAKFTIVKSATVTPIVNVTSTNFTFSSANVLNSTENSYTVVLGVGENATFSAANSIYNGSTNGTHFAWNFGDGTTVNVTNETTNHTYTTVTGAANDTGTLTVTTSGGRSNTTTFYVYVENSKPVAKLSTNATANQTLKTTGGTPYIEINWNTTLSFNAANSSVATPNVLSIASYALVAKNVKKTANFTVANGSNVSANWSVDFSPPKTIGTGPYLTQADVNGTYFAFFGWEYNVTLTVWSGTGGSANTTLAILLNDTQPPAPSFTILNAAGKAVAGSAITEAPNGSAVIRLDAANSTDPNNGSVVKYTWNITNGNNSSLAQPNRTVTSVTPYPTYTLLPETNPYTINLTVTDKNGNTANKSESLTVSPNTTLRPVMSALNLTGPSSLTQGQQATFWVNVSDTGGSKSYAQHVTVSWYVLSPSGGGSKKFLSGSPGSTVFYNYTSKGVVNKNSMANGTLLNLSYNRTVRAVFTWNPSFTGNYVLYANVTATNEFVPDYKGSSNLASLSVSIHANPTTQLLEYGGIAAAVIVAIVLLVWWTRRPARKAGTGKSSGRGGLERGSKRSDSDTSNDKS
jgi:hypothetical protein